MKRCPFCRSAEVYLSHRSGLLERGPLTWIGVRPFRCGACQGRFYRFARHDPRLTGKGPDSIGGSEQSRPPRWPVKAQAVVTVERPGEAPVTLAGAAENASIDGLRLRLPESVPEGSRVSVSLEGGAPVPGTVRWTRPEGGQDVLHGLQLDDPWTPHSVHTKPLRRLRRRRLLRRLLIGIVALGLIALISWGLVCLMDAFRAYNPQYYEPKDTERERHQLQQRLEEISRPR